MTGIQFQKSNENALIHSLSLSPSLVFEVTQQLLPISIVSNEFDVMVLKENYDLSY